MLNLKKKLELNCCTNFQKNGAVNFARNSKRVKYNSGNWAKPESQAMVNVFRKTSLLLCLIFACVAFGYAQTLKVTNTNQIKIKNPQFTNSSNYTLEVVGSMHKFSHSTSGASGWMVFQLGTANPRISGAGNTVCFFDAAAYTHNDIQVRNVFYYSDINAKKNVQPIFNSLDIIERLNPITFDWINEETARKTEAGVPLQEIGFIAQEVEEVLPNIVVNDEEGRKLVNYTAIIPVLTEAVKSLNNRIIELEGELAACCNTEQLQPKNKISKDNTDQSYLEQNYPNPFNISTDIKYFISEDSENAVIYIYNLQGVLKLQKPVSQKGEGIVTILGSELEAGMYFYSLFINDKEIDTKKMLLTN